MASNIYLIFGNVGINVFKNVSFMRNYAQIGSRRSNLRPRKPETNLTPGRRQSKTSILSMNVDKNSLETEFSIAICRQMAIVNTVSS